jgi:D-alanine--poly(phosphoribitol) ligase subunit 2
MDVKAWIIEWFEKNTNLKRDDIEKNICENYLEKGWIDSFKFISFITDIEEKFNIRFSNDQFQDRSFSTIKGIVKIIEEKINGKV